MTQRGKPLRDRRCWRCGGLRSGRASEARHGAIQAIRLPLQPCPLAGCRERMEDQGAGDNPQRGSNQPYRIDSRWRRRRAIRAGLQIHRRCPCPRIRVVPMPRRSGDEFNAGFLPGACEHLRVDSAGIDTDSARAASAAARERRGELLRHTVRARRAHGDARAEIGANKAGLTDGCCAPAPSVRGRRGEIAFEQRAAPAQPAGERRGGERAHPCVGDDGHAHAAVGGLATRCEMALLGRAGELIFKCIAHRSVRARDRKRRKRKRRQSAVRCGNDGFAHVRDGP